MSRQTKPVIVYPIRTDNVRGRGLVLTMQRDRYDPFKVGDLAQWHATEYIVTGVETTSSLMYPPTLGKLVGLVVRKVGDEER